MKVPASIALIGGILIGLLSSCRPGNQEAQNTDLGEGGRSVSTDGMNSVGGEGKQLFILSWSDYLVPDLLDQFQSETGCQLEVVEVENSEQMLQAFESNPSAFDIVIGDDKTFSQFLELHLLKELDLARIQSFSEVSPSFKRLYFDPENRYSVPYLWGSTVIAYRADRVRSVDDSWSMLWRSDLKGRMSMLDEPEDLFFITLLSMGVNPSNPTEDQVAEAGRRLVDAFVTQDGKMFDYSSALDGLEVGSHDLVITYSGDATMRARANEEIRVARPIEGMPIWVDSFGISRETVSSDLCHRFINFMCRPEVAAVTANELCYSSPNEGAKSLISPDLLNDRALYPEPELMAKSSYIRFSKESEPFVKKGVKLLFDELRRQGVNPDGVVAQNAVDQR